MFLESLISMKIISCEGNIFLNTFNNVHRTYSAYSEIILRAYFPQYSKKRKKDKEKGEGEKNLMKIKLS